jgi:hypothetical protein
LLAAGDEAVRDLRCINDAFEVWRLTQRKPRAPRSIGARGLPRVPRIWTFLRSFPQAPA